MKKALLLGIALLILILLYLFPKIRSCSRLSCVSMRNLNAFQLEEVFKEDKSVYRAQYRNGGLVLETEVRSDFDENEAQQYITASTARMKGLFSDAPAPYPGVISDAIVCDRLYRPTFHEVTTNSNVRVSYFTGYFNQNLVFGSCTESQANYKGIIAYFYCPAKKQAFQVELISPVGIYEKAGFVEMIRSTGCK